MSAPIQASEFQSANTVTLARELVGKVLVRERSGGAVSRHVITETEAYHGQADRACHASRGRTPRTEVMFRPGGIWYVYLCYGIHEMLNLVTGPADFPAAILIRALDEVTGPGRLTRSLGIGRTLNGQPAAPASGLWIEDHGLHVPENQLLATPRIGVDYAGEEWSMKPWRFVWAGPRPKRKNSE